MSEPWTQVDLKNFSDGIANSPIDWDRFATARGYANRKSAQKAMRRASKKLPPPTPTTGTPATQPQREPQATLPRPKKVAKRSNVSSGRPKTSKQGKNVPIPRKGTNSTIAQNGGSGTRSNTTGGIKKGKEGKRGLAREGAGKGRVEGIGEDVAQGAGEGVGQRVGQGSDRFVQGRPFNEKIDRDFRPDRREFLGDGETSEEEEEEEEADDDEEDDDDNESEED
ncbi:hypothetical protein KC318_g16704 [Hortaea werneckii]|nr:hypothetical protein KC334_g12463 [Hortaea werneckii]KAI6963948.1 hypothetical protein KC355_g12366 [Hortaea werneckii]KAI7168698.1 hypothetical protein KC324_g11526 [Hortaea werneckii]KAI7571661.1 hypothetical protein KC316_g11999 [Hortaea werneckii]KAI7650071.1 hypothetical protein KC318_g16704 [Hortaea werneckii]